jgi:hypothetical protein
VDDRHHPCGEPAAEWIMAISRRERERAKRTQAMKERTTLLVLLFVALLCAATIFGCWPAELMP